MFKRILAAALVMGGIVAIPAQATPVLWEINPSGSYTPTGSFMYDADTNTYSNIAVLGSFATFYWQGSGTATQLNMWTSLLLPGSSLTLFFTAPLTNAGIETNFYSSESALYGYLHKAASGTVTDPPIGTVTVPEPGTLTLLGVGLAALGLMRRRKSA